jgi:hypothetical protein
MYPLRLVLSTLLPGEMALWFAEIDEERHRCNRRSVARLLSLTRWTEVRRSCALGDALDRGAAAKAWLAFAIVDGEAASECRGVVAVACWIALTSAEHIADGHEQGR